MMKDFIDWLNGELGARGWSNSELARRAGVTGAAISHLVNRKNNPSFEICVGIANAFGERPETIFRRASLLPPLPPEVAEEQELIHNFRTLSPTERQSVIRMLRGLTTSVAVIRDLTDPYPEDEEEKTEPVQERQPQTLKERAAAALLEDMEGLTEDEQDEVFRFMKWIRDRGMGVAGATENAR